MSNMEIRTDLNRLKLLSALILLLFFVGCAGDSSYLKPEKRPEPEKIPVVKEKIPDPVKAGEVQKRPEVAAGTAEKKKIPELPKVETKPETLPPPKGRPKEKSQTPPPVETPRMSDQEMLDSALEFCQASYDFWEQGDLDNAIDALDQAYSLILKVNPDQAALLQQKEDLRITISKRIMEVYASRFTVVNGIHKAIPLVMNGHVEMALNLLKGKERKFFLDAYRRSGIYRPAIVKSLKEAGLPEELSWLPLIESGFKVRALSRARALGLWQFIASTGYKYGLKRDRWIDERMDPEKATRAAIAYLKELHQIFGDWDTVLAAYNCGEGTVLKRIRSQKINYLDHFWDLYQQLPRETAFYVPKFLAVLHIMNDPEAHGFRLPPVDKGVETEEVPIDKQVHLKTMAKYLGISYSELRGLNPELRRDSTPNRPYALKLPRGKGAVLLAKLNEIPAWHPPVPVYEWHRVRKGETLSVIARLYGTSVGSIIALNGLRSKHYIKVGWNLKIPTRMRYASIEEPQPVKTHTSLAGKKPIEYVVGKGDSLWKIAQRFGTTTEAIRSLNHMKNSNLRIGQVLVIRSIPAEEKRIGTRNYTVLKGDSPYLIARKHQMNLSDLLKLNNLTPRSTIFPGQVLLVSPG